MPRRGRSEGRQRIASGWEVCATPAGAVNFADLDEPAVWPWQSIPGALPVAAALRALGAWSLDAPPRNFDAEDWWFRVTFELESEEESGPWQLGFDGLAGVCDIWLDRQWQGRSESMFVRAVYPLPRLPEPGRHCLVLKFSSLDAWLAQRRPRPRWRAPMVAHAQLRWARTTLLGRTPGWSPPAAAVGPWRPVWVAPPSTDVTLVSWQLDPRLLDDGAGALTVRCVLTTAPGVAIERVELELQRNGEARHAVLDCLPEGPDAQVCAAQWGGHGTLRWPTVDRWWPHTHGEPALYDACLRVHLVGDDAPRRVPLRRVGFRDLQVDQHDGGFDVIVNGVRVFCRGACWMPLDVVSLQASEADYRASLARVCDAGMNMLRVSGCTTYESTIFWDLCDALGILVWQDLMFANMDYPFGDAEFLRHVREEVTQQCQDWHARPALALLCGNSEVEQQAAMWGAPREQWASTFFDETLPAWLHDGAPGVMYWPSSAHGGAFPHQVNAGTCSYYGVGAYRRPLADARGARPRFATECLAFANVPDEATLARLPDGEAVRVHQAAWKTRVPRDLGAGWDFDDVRDHYLTMWLGESAVALRQRDHDRYLALSRVVTGEVMAAAMAEWRRADAGCGGALVHVLRDLWAGAGWGVLDDQGRPKACFYALRRVLQPVAVWCTDEGLNGLRAHVANDRPTALKSALRLRVFNDAGICTTDASVEIMVPPHTTAGFDLAAMTPGFEDLNDAYRFGASPPALTHVTLLSRAGQPGGEAHVLPAGLAVARGRDVGLSASVSQRDDGRVLVRVCTAGFAQSVSITLAGHEPEDNHFHLAPGDERCVVMHRLTDCRDDGEGWRGQVQALNAAQRISLRLGGR